MLKQPNGAVGSKLFFNKCNVILFKQNTFLSKIGKVFFYTNCNNFHVASVLLLKVINAFRLYG